MGKNDSDINDEDRSIFRQHVSSMQQSKTTPSKSQCHHTSSTDPEPPSFNFGASDIQEYGPEDTIYFYKSGVSEQIKRSMKRGNVTTQGRLDLHGKTIDESTRAMTRFIEQHKQHKHRWLLIIHGKGSKSPEHRPIIKNLTAKLLRSHPDVIAFHSATGKHGGTGAVYVLLKAMR